MELPDEIYLEWNEDGYWTNLPYIVVDKRKPFEWGNRSNGAADLALNILEWALRKHGYDGARIKVSKGMCFSDAYTMHTDFKREMIATIPQRGKRTFTLQEVLDWIENYDPAKYEDFYD